MAKMIHHSDSARDALKRGVDALANTVKIAAACEVTLPLGQNNAPLVRVILPAGKALPRHDDPAYGGDGCPTGYACDAARRRCIVAR